MEKHHDQYYCSDEWDPYQDFYQCVEGTLIGPCEDVSCGGLCSAVGACDCSCHGRPL